MDILLLSIILFLVLQVLDVDSTKKVLANGGRELNPIVDFFMKKFGINKGLIIAKLIVVPVILYFYGIGQINLTVITIVNVIYIAVVVNNYRIAKK
jgi:hypothetical protein